MLFLVVSLNAFTLIVGGICLIAIGVEMKNQWKTLHNVVILLGILMLLISIFPIAMLWDILNPS